ncbi:katanin p60 ATPase-containing subunit A-like 2 [Topomyia yanbarensis]|uniref:katanin p60 ATPase-containing subunit A-like 2 n=1 Tax=Topomyia yanbarensis TaxID=2498891 RepID=UPI00273C5B12|nr:katanin p60 ATPase-containing subunit A-like 2 [Topomyia yanbarensis]
MSFEQDKRSLYERRRNILYLMANYLSIMGLEQSRQTLIDETHLTDEFQVCDNIDLDTIYQEYCSYYQLKFGKQPHVVKKNETYTMQPPPAQPQRKPSGNRRRVQPTVKPLPMVPCRVEPEADREVRELGSKMTVSQLAIPRLAQQNNIIEPTAKAVKPVENGHSSAVKYNVRPLIRLHENYSSEWKDFADIVCRDLMKKDLHHRWSQVKGLDTAIKLLKESVVTPLQYPQLFVGLTRPWRCVLLHGPPGTGKTLLARTLCSETQESITFFNATSATLISKWRGESEKLIRVLYDVARFYAPSIIFIDEFDGLASRRDSAGEHEASKRFKNEFLTLVDGLDSGADDERVFLLASTNLPWEIDPAFLRRFEKKILVDVPCAEGRKAIINDLLPVSNEWNAEQLDELVEMTDNFTGDEIRIACKEASMMLIRNKIEDSAGSSPACSSADPDTVQFDQLKTALEQIKPASYDLIHKHREWNRKYGNHS